MSNECGNRNTVIACVLDTMTPEKLIEYDNLHISMDSQDLIDALVSQLSIRVKNEAVDNGLVNYE